jgi:hypothetical protein
VIIPLLADIDVSLHIFTGRNASQSTYQKHRYVRSSYSMNQSLYIFLNRPHLSLDISDFDDLHQPTNPPPPLLPFLPLPPQQFRRLREHQGENHLAETIHIDVGFLISSKYGGEGNQAAVDVKIYDPQGVVIHEENSQAEGELELESPGGGQGPWRVCFKVARGQILRPSVIVKVSYFTINADMMLGTAFEWQAEDADHAIPEVDPSMLGTQDQIKELQQGLVKLDHYLRNVTNEQKYLYARTVRHLKTAKSTHTRAFWYSLLVSSVIAAASFVQVAGVRMMFKNSRKQGLII